MLLKIALNGARSKKESTYLPHSLNEIGEEVTRLYHYGYKVFHIHCYDEVGNESLKPDDVNKLVSLVKNISPDIQIGLSCGEWIEPDFEKRNSYIKDWINIPDFISMNMIEEGALEISELLISKGILIEAGINEKRAAEIFAGSKLDQVCRVLIEPEDEETASAIETINQIVKVLDENNIKIPRLLHGFNAAAWDILREAKWRGYDSRIGMEDTLILESGERVKNNLELVQYAEKILNSV